MNSTIAMYIKTRQDIIHKLDGGVAISVGARSHGKIKPYNVHNKTNTCPPYQQPSPAQEEEKAQREKMGALPEMWDAMHSWFTPSVLFVVLNLVIGTIAFTSALRTPKPPHQQHTNNTAKLSNTPSFLHRITSFNFNTQHSQAIPSQPQPNEPKQNREVEVETEQVQDNEDVQVQEEVVKREEEVEITVALGRSKSDAQPLADLRPPPLPSRLKKSGTVDSPFAHFVLSDCIEGDEGQGQDQDVHVGDKEDDFKAKADSFIRGFKEQLKLQRNESFLRYRAMLHRGTA